jgi:tetratricopeptide (TPR) repeat protein
VYHAHDNVLGRDVAIKVLTSETSAALGRDRFEQEIRLTSRLVHPNIVPLFDSGTFDDRLFYVMPFLQGETLRQRLTREGHFGTEEVVGIAIDIAEALAYAHGAGVVHRDLKPENIFWYHGRAMLADFGIAKPVGGANPQGMTETGTFVGTLGYMSPEQAQGVDAVDGRADLYSLGCILFELLTGDLPYPGPTMMAFLSQHLTTPVPRVRDRAPAVPSRLSALTEALLAKEPGGRPASALEVLATLRATSGGGTAAPAPVPVPVPGPAPVPAPTRPEPHHHPDSVAACLEGRDLFVRSYQGGVAAKEKLEYAKALFERARDIDPTNPLAFAGLADVHHVMGFRGFSDFQTETRLASEYRAQALRLGPDVAAVRISIAVELLYWKDDFESAGAEFRRAVACGGVHADGHRLYGSWLKMAGKFTEALAEMRLAMAGEKNAPALQVGLADVLMSMGRYVEAIEPLREALRLNPGYESALERLDICCTRLGRHDEALDARRALHGFRQRTEQLAALDADLERMSPAEARVADIRRELDRLVLRATKEDAFVDLNVSRQLADYIIIAHAELGEWKKAMDWVEKGFYRRPGRLRRVLTDLPFDRRGLAIDGRYARLLRTAGLEQLLQA